MATIKDILYYRYIIQKCVEFNKVLIVTGEYNGSCSNDYSKLTFLNITPYLPETYVSSSIADHINLTKEECMQYISLESLIKGHKFILVGKPYVYKNKNGDIKGGLILSNELSQFGIEPICHWSKKYLKNIPYNLIIDFRKEFNGVYGWKNPSLFSANLSSEYQELKKNKYSDKFSFSIEYLEDLNSKQNLAILIKDDDNEIQENEINDDDIVDEDNSNVENNKIIELNPSQDKIRDIDNNLSEYSTSIKAPPILLPKSGSDLQIPQYRRK